MIIKKHVQKIYSFDFDNKKHVQKKSSLLPVLAKLNAHARPPPNKNISKKKKLPFDSGVQKKNGAKLSPYLDFKSSIDRGEQMQAVCEVQIVQSCLLQELQAGGMFASFNGAPWLRWGGHSRQKVSKSGF